MKNPDSKFVVKNGPNGGEIYLYDVIGEDIFGGISAQAFQTELGKLKAAKNIDVHINSGGGDVFTGNTIYTLLKSHPAKINVYVDGLAASIASVIAMAGDTVEIAQNAMMMIHDPFGMSFGTAEDHRKLADLLETIKGTIADTYARRSGNDREHMLELMANETWFTAQEALDAKLADRIGSEMAVAACIRSDLFKYRNMPASLTAQAPSPEEKLSYEAALRKEIRTLKGISR